ncbi:MAG: sigma 54-interacting transcriptional regulator, partial [Pseudomonadota bacterium]|nr:sigma 54-interacting transcriptional regulator [Pseudomonadota bacterium]
MKNITLIEDEPIIRGSLSRLLTKHGYSVRDFDTIRMAKEANAIDTVDLIISDVRLPGEDGTTLLKTTDTPVLIMTSYASLKSAVQIMKDGAVDYVAKPFDNAEMLKAVKSAISQSSEGAASKAKTRGELKSHIIGQGAAMQRVKAEIEQVAPTDMTVLITGEMGTGKRLIAKAIHELSFRHDKPFKAITCSQIKDGQLYELLFGDESVLNAIKGGTLFIDEIGRMSLENQSQLLDFIRSAKDNTDNRPVRLISASHQDLKMLIQQKLFREDLYFHLNVFSIHLPPL